MEQTWRNISPSEHIAAIFKDYTTPSRVLQSFTNLSNTVIQTALSGQSKFVFEILQNADDAFEDENKPIEVQFILHEHYLIVLHDGKGFDYNDVERICDYASQIEEVKATDLSKTGYKGLGFKSLFNISDCIYIHSNGYSFRFDKTYWPDAQNKPWQVIPVWCNVDELPLSHIYSYNHPVNFILQVKNLPKFEEQLRELVAQPHLLLYLHRINKLTIIINEEKHYVERKIENFGLFDKVSFSVNEHTASTWILRKYTQVVPKNIQKLVSGGSQFIYPDKIKKAHEVGFTFALKTNESLSEISKVKGLCYCTLPTQLSIFLPYHTNSFFILNLDRTQLHENEWNEFLVFKISHLQFCLLKDLAEIPNLKNYVIELFVREINHPYKVFNLAFAGSFNTYVTQIGWLPSYQGSGLLKLGEAWTDETEFFKQNFRHIKDSKISYLIDYNVRRQGMLYTSEAKCFTYEHLFREFPKKYYPQLTKDSHTDFISYLYERLKPNSQLANKLKNVPFLVAKNGMLICPQNALLEEDGNPIPDFSLLNPVDNKFLPTNDIDLIKAWLVQLGAKILMKPNEVLQESVFKWIDFGDFDERISTRNHADIITYISKCFWMLTAREIEILKQNLLVCTESNEFKLAKNCYLPDAVPIEELADAISSNEMISSSYDISSLREFFVRVGVCDKMSPVEVISKSILAWIRRNKLRIHLTKDNYSPIIEYCATHYPTIQNCLKESEKKEMKKLLVLTCSGIFQKAEVCYFDFAIPRINGLEYVVAADKLVSTKNVSDNVREFLSKIGVQKELLSSEILRRSVLMWIQQNDVASRITVDNHEGILSYISGQWSILKSASSGLTESEKRTLKKIPILTENGTFRPAFICFLPPSHSDKSNVEEIPNLESIISKNEFVSSNYSEEIKEFLKSLGVRNLTFIDIHEKYSSHLNCTENINWFLSKLVHYWKNNKESLKNNNLLQFLAQKFRSSRSLLARNGQSYCSNDLYASRFEIMHSINPDCVPLLDFGGFPEELENLFGFKKHLDLKCIKQLLKTLEEKNSALGKDGTCYFFKIILKELRQNNNKSEIQNANLRLMTKENRLRPASDLYYFQEEDATCILDSCYLKRIQGMSHGETLELAELCGVTVLPFKEEVIQYKETRDNTLHLFYLERLPCIVLLESRELNEPPSVTLKRLYGDLCALRLYRCSQIFVMYPFGQPVRTKFHSNGAVLNVVGKWSSYFNKSKVRRHMEKILDLKSDVTVVLDMDPLTASDIEEWLVDTKMNPQAFHFIKQEVKRLSISESFGDGIPPNMNWADIAEDQLFLTSDESENESEAIGNQQGIRTDADAHPFMPAALYNNRMVAAVPLPEGQHNPILVPIKDMTINLPLELDEFLSLGDEKSRIKWLSEKFVFFYLQDHYTTKYPGAEVDIFRGTFSLQCRQQKVEIFWANERGNKRLSYDLLVKKGGTVSQIIQVKLIDKSNKYDFRSVHDQFVMKMEELFGEVSRSPGKYCIYHVFTTGVFAACEDFSKIATLYRTVILKS